MQALVPVQDLAQGLELLLRSGVQLDLELVETVEGAAVDQHLHRVDAEVGRRLAGREPADSTHLADREQLHQGRVATELQDHRARRRGRPIRGRRARVRRTFELLAPVQPALRRGLALEADHGFAPGSPQPGGEARPGEGPVGRVDVAVLDLQDADLAGRLERAQLGRDQIAIGTLRRPELVLHLDLDSRAP